VWYHLVVFSHFWRPLYAILLFFFSVAAMYCNPRDSSVGIALGYGLDDRGSRVRFPAGLGIFLFTTASRTALGPTQPPIQWIPGALSLGVKWPGGEADHSPPSSAEVTQWMELYLHSPNTPTWRCARLKHRDNFTFTLSIVTWLAEVDLRKLEV
jgi:hypothetical protein